METKQCTRCGRELPRTAEFFHPNGRKYLRSECRECASANQKQRRQGNPELFREYDLRRYQKSHEHILEQKRRYYAENCESIKAYQREYRLTHLDSLKARNQKRRAREFGADGAFTPEDIETQYKRQKGRCFYCRKRVGQDYHVDHVVPLALGGSNHPSNLVIACPLCNVVKGAKHPMEYCGRLF